jgi:hypothetical protein
MGGLELSMIKQRPIQIYTNRYIYYFRFKPPDRYKNATKYSYNNFISSLKYSYLSIVLNKQIIDKYSNLCINHINTPIDIKNYKLLTFDEVINLYNNPLLKDNIGVLDIIQLIIAKWDDWN